MLNKIAFAFILLAVSLISCQLPLATNKAWSNYKITKLRCENIHENPYIFGIVYIKDETGVHKWPGPTIRVEDEDFFILTEADGSYRYSLSPGKYNLTAGLVGYKKVKINQIILQKGDSIRINFLLRVDKDAHLY